jgi:hypothetical protein
MSATFDPNATEEERKNPMLIRSKFGDYDCVTRIKEASTIFKDFLAKGKNANKDDVTKAINNAKYLELFLNLNKTCGQYISEKMEKRIDDVLDLATKLGYTGGRRKASPKYKRTRRRKSKSKRTRRR